MTAPPSNTHSSDADPQPVAATRDDRWSVLVVDDEPAILTVLTEQLQAEFDVLPVNTAEQARAVLAARQIDIVLTDLQLSDGSGLHLLEWVQHAAPRAARVLLTGTASVEDAADAINCCRVHRLVLKPWRTEDLLVGLRELTSGLSLHRRHDELNAELRRLNAELERRVADRTAELEHAMQQLQMKNQILEKMALTDALTGLPNRRAIELIARKELLRRTRAPAPIAFGLVDADRFKDINSEYLLSGGDHVLTWLGHTLQGSVRATDALGRVGGEEFMIVAPGTDADGAEVLAERVRSTVEAGRTKFRDADIRVTVSVGFAVAEAGVPVGYDALREAAAVALAEAKNTGRNRSVIRPVG